MQVSVTLPRIILGYNRDQLNYPFSAIITGILVKKNPASILKSVIGTQSFEAYSLEHDISHIPLNTAVLYHITYYNPQTMTTTIDISRYTFTKQQTANVVQCPADRICVLRALTGAYDIMIRDCNEENGPTFPVTEGYDVILIAISRTYCIELPIPENFEFLVSDQTFNEQLQCEPGTLTIELLDDNGNVIERGAADIEACSVSVTGQIVAESSFTVDSQVVILQPA